MGYKIFGKATYLPNQPLKLPQKLQSINKSGQVILDLGKAYKLFGITTIASIPSQEDVWKGLGRKFTYFERQMNIQRLDFEVEIETPDSPISKVWYKERIIYTGNDVRTWWTCLAGDREFFPPRKPMFRKSDLAKLLVQDGLAIPDVELFRNDELYAKELILSIRDRTIREINVEQNKDDVINLGKYLCDTYPDLFNQGAWFLAHCSYKDIFEPVRNKLNELLSLYDTEVKTKGNYYSNQGYTIDSSKKIFELIDILIKATPGECKAYLNEILTIQREPYLRVPIALKLLVIGDISGLDLLMEEVNAFKSSKGNRSGLASELDDILSNHRSWRFEANDKEMYEWYQKNRLNLQWDEEKHRVTLKNTN